MPAAANANSHAAADTQVEIIEPAVLIGLEDMDFGSITPRGNPGTVVLTPSASATCNATGGLVRSGTCRAATFDGDVTFLHLLRVQEPAGNQITLSGPGGATMQLDNFSFGSGPGLWNLGRNGAEQRFLILNLDGTFTFYVGGTLHIDPAQAPGQYFGTFEIELNYD